MLVRFAPSRRGLRHPFPPALARGLAAALMALAVTLVSTAPVSADALTRRDIDDIGATLDADGYYIEFEADTELASAVDEAIGADVAFVWLNDDNVGLGDAEGLLDRLGELSSRFHTVLVLGGNGVWADSDRFDVGLAALDALPEFAADREAEGIRRFLGAIENPPVDSRGTGGESSGTGGESSRTGGESSGTGGSLGWLWIVLLVVLGFFLIRWLLARRRDQRAEAELIRIDRAEIAEQLKNNADRVIELGDKVIASKDSELISTYEEASATYQDVSTQLEAASTVDVINRLDERIDHAEWQFEVIEARLAGRRPPDKPGPPSAPASPNGRGSSVGQEPDEPALGPDESVLGPRRRGSSSNDRRTARERSQRRRTQGRRSSSGGGLGDVLGGGLGGALGGVLGGVLGGSKPRNTSRRSRQRRAASGSWDGGGSILPGPGSPGGSRPSSGTDGRTSNRSGGGSFGSARRSTRSRGQSDGRGGGGSF